MPIQTPPGLLELVLQRTSEDVFEPDSVADAPLVRFTAYTIRQHVHGWVRLRADRLTDLLNAHDDLLLMDVELETLASGLIGTVDEVLIRRADLIAVQAAGPRGHIGLRLATERHPIAVQVGDYLVGGHLHAVPGVDPIASAWERPAMVPLTEAWIELWTDGRRQHQSLGTVIVNRDLADWIRVVTEDDLTSGRLRPTEADPR